MTVVVCTPGGAQGELLAGAGAEQARLTGRELVLLRHVRLTEDDQGRVESAVDATLADLRAQARSLERQGITCHAEVVSSTGDDPGPSLIDAIRRLDAGLVVIGIRSRSRVGKLLLGSTAQDLLLGTGRRILAVPVEPAA